MAGGMTDPIARVAALAARALADVEAAHQLLHDYEAATGGHEAQPKHRRLLHGALHQAKHFLGVRAPNDAAPSLDAVGQIKRDLRPDLVALGFEVRREHLLHELCVFGGIPLDDAGRIIDALESEDDDPRWLALVRVLDLQTP